MRSTTMFLISCLFFGCFFLNSCNNAENTKTEEVKESAPAFDLNAAKKEIEASNRNFMEFFAKGDSVSLANLYTSDGQLMFADAPSYEGRAKIQNVFAGISKSGLTKADLKTQDVFGNEDLLAEQGIVDLYANDKAVAQEKYIVLWKKEDGKWKMFRDISNSNWPAPASK